jgi:hypothetical protein
MPGSTSTTMTSNSTLLSTPKPHDFLPLLLLLLLLLLQLPPPRPTRLNPLRRPSRTRSRYLEPKLSPLLLLLELPPLLSSAAAHRLSPSSNRPTSSSPRPSPSRMLLSSIPRPSKPPRICPEPNQLPKRTSPWATSTTPSLKPIHRPSLLRSLLQSRSELGLSSRTRRRSLRTRSWSRSGGYAPSFSPSLDRLNP